MPEPAFSYEAIDVPLSAGVPKDVVVPVNHARDWMVLIENTGSNPLTGLSMARAPVAEHFETPSSVAAGIPLAAGSKLAPIEGRGEPVQSLLLRLTSSSGTTVTIRGAGG